MSLASDVSSDDLISDFGPETGAEGISLAPVSLPDKLYFRIGEVSKLTTLKAHVLRYWETEFPSIAPKKVGSNHRMYRRKDVELILEIKHLLYEKRYTIEGARKHLDQKPKGAAAKKLNAAPKVQSSLFAMGPEEATPAPPNKRVIKELKAILQLLS